MTSWDIRKEYLHRLSASVMSEFTRVMDSLSDSEWVRFASQVLNDQTDIRLAEQKPRRTDWVMNRWGMENGTVGELLDILQDQQLYRPRDIILAWRPPGRQQPPPPPTPRLHPPPDYFTPPPKDPRDTTLSTKPISQPGVPGRCLPRPGPPPPDLDSRPQSLQLVAPDARVPPNVMCWPFEEVQRGTENFSAARLIGQGGFGHVYHATMRNTDYAVKRLKEDSPMDWNTVKESFRTEVETLSRYRHANIVELMGYSVSGGTHCLLYAFMPNGSLEDQLHSKDSAALSWSQRVSVLLGSAQAIQFLHACDPVLIHGDIKSSNILLGEHLEAKLGDFGLARFCRAPARPGQTSSVVTKTVRGTVPYLPDEYTKGGKLGVGVDIYSFGVVLLEVLTGRRALEKDSQSKMVYLKDLSLVEDDDDDRSFTTGRSGSQEAFPPPAATHIWRSHLDPRLLAEGNCGPRAAPGPQASLDPARPPWSLDLAGWACRCLDKRSKRRPPMTQVFQKLQEVHTNLKTLSGATSSLHLSSPPLPPPPPPPHIFPKPPHSVDSSMGPLTQSMSRLGPLEDTYHGHSAPSTVPPPPPSLTASSSSASSSSASSSSASSSSASASPASSLTASSLRGPCESDESQGYSQYSAPSLQATSHSGTLGCGAYGGLGAFVCPSPADSLHSNPDLPNRQVDMNPSKQRFLHRMALYHQGTIHTDEINSSHDLYFDPTNRRPEESDELAYLPGEALESPANTPT